jgi:hypothetical protein
MIPGFPGIPPLSLKPLDPNALSAGHPRKYSHFHETAAYYLTFNELRALNA